MAFDDALFREQFPEFSDNVKYTPSQMSFWASIAEASLIEQRWGQLYTQGLSLFVAHNLVLATQNVKAASRAKGSPGTHTGAAQSKTVGSASVSYDLASKTVEKGGPWNLTTYGGMLLQLARMIGVGAHQV